MATASNLIAQYGISKTIMHSICINAFRIDPEYDRALQKYYILHWNGAQFKHANRHGCIPHQAVDYLVVFHNCRPGEIKPDTELYLSFRWAHKEYELRPYVLVCIKGKA